MGLGAADRKWPVRSHHKVFTVAARSCDQRSQHERIREVLIWPRSASRPRHDDRGQGLGTADRIWGPRTGNNFSEITRRCSRLPPIARPAIAWIGDGGRDWGPRTGSGVRGQEITCPQSPQGVHGRHPIARPAIGWIWGRWAGLGSADRVWGPWTGNNLSAVTRRCSRWRSDCATGDRMGLGDGGGTGVRGQDLGSVDRE